MNDAAQNLMLGLVSGDPRGRDVCISRNKAGALALELWKRGDQLRLVLWGRRRGAAHNTVLARFYGADQQALRLRLEAWFAKHPDIRAQGMEKLNEA